MSASNKTRANRQVVWLIPIFLIAGCLLYLSLRGIKWQTVAEIVRSISIPYALLSVALGMLPMLFRAARWQILLQAQAPVTFRTSFWAVAAGYFGNNFLPARGGELVRSYIIQSRSELSLTYVLATALSERVVDAVALVLAGSAILTLLPQAKSWMDMVRGSIAAIGIAATFGLVLLPLIGKRLQKRLAHWPRPQAIFAQLLLGIGSLHNATRLLKFVALTIVLWAIDAAATSILALSLSIHMSIAEAFLLIVALSLSSAIPAAPGYVGVYQFVAVTTLKPFGISSSAAIAFILVMQALSYATTSLFGLLAVTCFTPLPWRLVQNPRKPIQTQN